jgi:threonine/homoserine/homoserine lactone efflux protein
VLSLHSLLIYAGVYALAIAMPGPGVIAIAARALASGFRAAIPMAAGTAAGDLILMTLSAFGLAVLAQAMGSLFFVVKLAGALYIVWLGYRYWTAPVGKLELSPISARRGFLAQMALTVGNPKAIAFFAALLPTVVDLAHLNAAGYLQLVLATLVMIPAITLSYAALAARIRGSLMSIEARRRLNKGAGAVMMGAGLGVAVI